MSYMKQLEMETKFSKRMKDWIAVDNFMDDSGQLMSNLVEIIDRWRGGTFWPMMADYVNRLPDTEQVVMEVMFVMVTKYKEVQLQGVAVELGSRLGFHNVVQAAKIGSSILAIIAVENDDLVKINTHPDGIDIISALVLDQHTREKIRRLSYLPPNLVPAVWKEKDKNYGGWQWEKKSVILGAGNHHEEYQALDVLNRLQSIAWELDIDVLTSEEHDPKKITHDEKEILGHYVGEKFYFTWRYDKRGRIYSSGYQINPQSDEYGKAILSPHKREICTQEGVNELKKYAFAMLMDDKPMLARKADMQLAIAQRGKPVNATIELDASCSGAQVMALLSGCMKTAKLCNLTSDPNKNDLYTYITERMQDRIGSEFNVTRQMAKDAIMPSLYNSQAKPKEVFGSNVDIYWEVMTKECPGIIDTMRIMNEAWNPNVDVHSWELPDGHVARVKVTNERKLRISIAELNDRKMTLVYKKNEPSKDSTSLPANITHSVDAYIVREMVRRCPFDLSVIHDCFIFHPNYAEEVRQQYRLICNEIASSNLLSSICNQIAGYNMGIKVGDEGLPGEILYSKHAIN